MAGVPFHGVNHLRQEKTQVYGKHSLECISRLRTSVTAGSVSVNFHDNKLQWCWQWKKDENVHTTSRLRTNVLCESLVKIAGMAI